MLLPSKELFNGTKTPVTTTAEMRVALGQLRDYLAALLGEDSDNKAAARSLLGVINTIIPAGMAGLFFSKVAPSGWLKANGAAVVSDSYADLTPAIYCGDAANATAAWGYRCTNPANPSGSRSTIGAYIVLPDARGEFLRGFDDGRGIDISRVLWALQAGALLSHAHGVSDPGHAHSVYDPGHAHSYGSLPPFTRTGEMAATGSTGYMVGSSGFQSYGTAGAGTGVGIYAALTGISIGATGGTENLVRNLAALICIKY
ncbi:hypothetical protein FEE59_02850 [Herbaspirillum sp. RU 5E]|nr:hypothetical protein [Herbaspirillum sp. RU 5E]